MQPETSSEKKKKGRSPTLGFLDGKKSREDGKGGLGGARRGVGFRKAQETKRAGGNVAKGFTGFPLIRGGLIMGS